MFIYLYGEDSYRRREREGEIIVQYVKKHAGFRPERFDFSNSEAEEEFVHFLGNQSLFTPFRFAVLTHLEELSASGITFLKIFADGEEVNTTIIVTAEKKLGKEFAWLAKAAQGGESFEALQGEEFVAWAKKWATKEGLTFPMTTLRLLGEVYEGDGWGLVTELEKISLGAAFEEQRSVPDFFPLVQRIKGGQTVPQRLSALAYALDNEDPAAVFNVAAALGDPEFKTKMANYDVAIKSGKIEYEEALLDLVIGN